MNSTLIRIPTALILGLSILPFAICQGATQTSAPDRTLIFGNSGARSLSVARVANSRPLPSVPAAVLLESGPNHRVWTRTTGATQQNGPWRGKPAARLVELATGLNYFDGQQYRPAQAFFEPAPDGDGFVATHVQHNVRLLGDLNNSGAVTLTHGAVTLRSTPLAIALYDSASGKTAIISVVSNTAPIMVASNKVVFPDAFPGLADFVITLERGSFEADVAFSANPDPTLFGFPPETTRIQIITEYFNPPQPQRLRSPIYTETNTTVRARMETPDLVDERLTMGELTIGAGRAFMGDDPEPKGGGVPVAKEMISISGRTFLVESIVYQSAKPAISTLRPLHASVRPRTGKRKALLASSSFPKFSGKRVARSFSRRKIALQLASMAWNASSPRYIADSITLIGSNTGLTLQGDQTYFISGPVYCNGPLVIEGGAVVKYPTGTAYIQVNSTLTCLTSPYRPAIFTAADDYTVGEVLSTDIWAGYTGAIQSSGYANPALYLYYVAPPLANCRFSYCQAAVQVYQASALTISLSDCQLVNCIKGLVISGCGCGCGCGCGPTSTVGVVNTLFASVSLPLHFYSTIHTYGNFLQCTVDHATGLVMPGGTAGGPWGFYNSVLANVTSLVYGGTTTINGARNGFFQSPTIGTDYVQEDAGQQSPFAPVGYTDEAGAHFFAANAQGAYYLRPYSPFVDAGNAGYNGAALNADLTTRTTFPPDGVFTNDLTSSQTLTPTGLRDVDTPDLGYHYPAIDYVINGLTVNSATLNIDQGTVIAFVGNGTIYPDDGSYDWGIRLNPGGRLNVNGYPTNRVIFAHLQAIQEFPLWYLEPWGSLITFKNMVLSTGDLPVSPMAEARVRYADFPALAPGWYDLFPHFGDVRIFTPDYDKTYAAVADLELDGCLLQGGGFYYDDGGPQGRTLNMRNTIFERCSVCLQDTGSYDSYYRLPEYGSQTTVSNCLFYYAWFGFIPCNQSNSWTFIDNIFDHASSKYVYDEAGNYVYYNGPVAVNHHNAYIGMSGFDQGGDRLAPRDEQPGSDPILTSLTYATGPLGRFYLPATATALIDHGSRTASQASQYHFTTSAANTKELGTQLDIGPHYVALASGAPVDSNGDGMPDFLADWNGNGTEEVNEAPWQTANTATLTVVDPPNNTANLSGIVRLRMNLGANGGSFTAIEPLADDETLFSSSGVILPSTSTADIEIDTRELPDGTHSFSIQASGPNSSLSEYSPPITLATANATKWPAWQGVAEIGLNVSAQTPPTSPSCTLWFYGSSLPKSYSPAPACYLSTPTPNGTVDYSETLDNLHINYPQYDKMIYTFMSSPAQPRDFAPVQLPPQLQGELPPDGLWVVSYTQDTVDFNLDSSDVLDPLDNSQNRWCHDNRIGSWFECGAEQDIGSQTLGRSAGQNPGGQLGQTLPVRSSGGAAVRRDGDYLLSLLARQDVVNFYGCGHGDQRSFMGIPIQEWNKSLLGSTTRHRYRFAFVDGCWARTQWLGYFGADPSETLSRDPKDITFYDSPVRKLHPGAFLSWKTEVPLNYPTATAQNDPTTGLLCSYRQYETLCNWHSQLLFYWVMANWTLQQSIAEANTLAPNVPGSSPPNGPVPGWSLIVRHPTGQDVVFNPAQYLKLSGFGGLKFEDYNRRAAWYQR